MDNKWTPYMISLKNVLLLQSTLPHISGTFRDAFKQPPFKGSVVGSFCWLEIHFGLSVKARHKIPLLIYSEFKRTDTFPLKSSKKLRFSCDFRENRSLLIRFSSLSTGSEIWRRSLTSLLWTIPRPSYNILYKFS